MKKTILLVAMLDSIHTAKWVAQLHEQDWDVHLFNKNSTKTKKKTRK